MKHLLSGKWGKSYNPKCPRIKDSFRSGPCQFSVYDTHSLLTKHFHAVLASCQSGKDCLSMSYIIQILGKYTPPNILLIESVGRWRNHKQLLTSWDISGVLRFSLHSNCVSATRLLVSFLFWGREDLTEIQVFIYVSRSSLYGCPPPPPQLIKHVLGKKSCSYHAR